MKRAMFAGQSGLQSISLDCLNKYLIFYETKQRVVVHDTPENLFHY